MVPVHDTDIAQERWSQAEWKHYELWEKVEVKLRRRKALWIGSTLLVFLGLSSVPILIDRWPKWSALSVNRKLAQEMNLLKSATGGLNSSEHHALRIRFNPDHHLSYIIEQVSQCSDSSGTELKRGDLLRSKYIDDYVLLSPAQGKELGIPGLVENFCYDPLAGSQSTLNENSISGFGVISVKDLAEKRNDRISLLIFRGPSAELSFE